MSEAQTPAPTTDSTGSSAPAVRMPVKHDVDSLLEAYEEVEAQENAPETQQKQPASAKPEVDATGSAKPIKAAKEEEPKAEQEEAEPPKNIIKAKAGDQELDIPEDATITQEVNGKKVQFKVQEAVKALVNQETFNRNMDSRLSHLHAKERTFMSQMDNMRTRLGQLADRAKEGDLFGLFQFSAQIANRDPVEFEQEMLERFRNIYSKYEGLNPDQKRALFAEKKAQYISQQHRELLEKSQREEATNQLQTEVAQRCQQAGIEREVFDGLFYGVVKNFVEAKMPLNGKTFGSPEDVTVDDVFLYKSKLDMIDKVERAVERVAPDKLNPDFVTRVLKVVGDDFELTEQEIADLLSSGGIPLKSPAQENLTQRSQHLEKRGFGAQTPRSQASSNKQKALDPDDELYREFFRRR